VPFGVGANACELTRDNYKLKPEQMLQQLHFIIGGCVGKDALVSIYHVYYKLSRAGESRVRGSADPIKFELRSEIVYDVCVCFVLTSAYVICIWVLCPDIALTVITISKGGGKNQRIMLHDSALFLSLTPPPC